ncbi:MAG: DUF5666 domain-containing protein [Candidatus Moranbacteria bacterium]|nr:DUF5666 domain-containing protein [Candidatus Moranbacteria bacterium]
MTGKDKLYIAGTIFCLTTAGFLVFYEVRANKAENERQSAAQQSNLSVPVPKQVAADQPDANQPDSAGDNKAIPDPPSDNATVPNSTTNPNAEENIPSPGKPGSEHPQGAPQSIPDGSKPFFGQVSAISGSKITLSSMNNSTVTVIISSSTEFTGGIKSDIKAGIKVAGYGTTGSNGSIEAVKIMINPTMPSGGKPN